MRTQGLRLVLTLLVAAAFHSNCRAASLPRRELQFLHDLTRDVILASSVPPGSNGGGSWHLTNSCGFTLITPGKDTYTAFWVRDFSMAADSGLIPTASISNHLVLICKVQNGPEERNLKNGLRLPPWSIPDHIDYDGKGSFFPGSYGSGDDQGNGSCGRLPPIDDHYEFVHLAWLLWKQTKSAKFLEEKVNGVSIYDRLKSAFDSPVTELETGLAFTTEEQRAVGFGFCDAETHIGKLLFASLLRYRAAGELAAMTRATGRRNEAVEYEHLCDVIRANLLPAFGTRGTPGEWLRASTGTGKQPDVWGTLFALHLNVVDANAANALRKTVVVATRHGTLTYKGAVRHVPTDRDFSKSTSWERSIAPLNSYQNGAYWHTASGWLIKQLLKEDTKLARHVFDELMAHFREEDFRKGSGLGAPWEDLSPTGEHRNAVYLASVALPYSILKNY